jgi:hypothetical protein
MHRLLLASFAAALLLPAGAAVAAPKDWSSVHIRLSRSACYGSCPVYTVEIAGDGTVAYEGGAYTVIPGRQQVKVPREAIEHLVGQFEAADFASLQPAYNASVTDMPAYTVSLSVDGQEHMVYDYVGREVGMPAAVTALEDEIDRVAGTDRWVSGTAETIGLLRAQGFDFHSEAAADLLADAARYEHMAFLQGLLAEGAPLGGQGSGRGSLPLLHAVRGKAAIEAAVIDAALQRGTKPDLTQALGIAAQAGDAKRLQAVLARGGDASGRLTSGLTPLMVALSPEVIRLLAAAGADVNAVADNGATALRMAESEDVALALLAAKANPKVGTDPWGNKTPFRDQAREAGWTRVLAKLGA